jgi:tRNA dimethylallyltransferase
LNPLEEGCPVYILCGPTGVGKSQIALQIADKYKGEIVSADSRQVYTGMDIGTAKLSPAERRVRHHLLDVVRPDELFSAQDFCQKAIMVLNELKEKKTKPFVVGGTGLYLKALTEGLFAGVGRKPELRVRFEGTSTPELYAQLVKVDAEKAARLSKNDRQRIERALEVFHAHGKPMSELEKKRSTPAGFKFIWAGLNLERKELYRRIDERVEKQLADGWEEEVRRLKKAGFSPNWPAFKTIGYQEVYRRLADELDYSEMVQLIKQKTRNYAKRQLTWFRHQSPVQWFDAADPQAAEKIEKYWELDK